MSIAPCVLQCLLSQTLTCKPLRPAMQSRASRRWQYAGPIRLKRSRLECTPSAGTRLRTRRSLQYLVAHAEGEVNTSTSTHWIKRRKCVPKHRTAFRAESHDLTLSCVSTSASQISLLLLLSGTTGYTASVLSEKLQTAVVSSRDHLHSVTRL